MYSLLLWREVWWIWGGSWKCRGTQDYSGSVTLILPAVVGGCRWDPGLALKHHSQALGSHWPSEIQLPLRSQFGHAELVRKLLPEFIRNAWSWNFAWVKQKAGFCPNAFAGKCPKFAGFCPKFLFQYCLSKNSWIFVKYYNIKQT